MPINPIAIALSERKVVSIDLEAHGILLYEMFAGGVTEAEFPGTSALGAYFRNLNAGHNVYFSVPSMNIMIQPTVFDAGRKHNVYFSIISPMNGVFYNVTVCLIKNLDGSKTEVLMKVVAL